MKLEKLISKLQVKIYQADRSRAVGEKEKAREHLRAAKDLLDAEFLRD